MVEPRLSDVLYHPEKVSGVIEHPSVDAGLEQKSFKQCLAPTFDRKSIGQASVPR